MTVLQTFSLLGKEDTLIPELLGNHPPALPRCQVLGPGGLGHQDGPPEAAGLR